MKIGIFTDSFRPYTSGVVRSIELFSREFSDKGHEVYIFGPDYPLKHPPREEGVFRFISVPAPSFPDFSLPIPISFQLGATIRRLGLDIIHAQSPFMLGRLGARAARRHRLPLIFTFHTLYDQYVHYFPFAEQTSRQVVQAISRDFCNRCNAVVAPSQLVVNYLKRIGVTVSLYNIPTGVDLREFAYTDENWLVTRHGADPAEKILLFVGRLGKEKNVFFLLEAFQRVQKHFPRTRLVLVGRGPEEKALRSRASEMGLGSKVTFTGMLNRDEIVHCYASADLFVFPSVTETQGLVIGEAKAVGLPVVAVRAFGPAEMVEHEKDGFLTDPTQESFSNAIFTLLRDGELRSRMGSKAMQNVRNVSSAHCAEKMLDLYRHLIDRGEQAPRKKNPLRRGYFSRRRVRKALKQEAAASRPGEPVTSHPEG